jgi:hypothetical protein
MVLASYLFTPIRPPMAWTLWERIVAIILDRRQIKKTNNQAERCFSRSVSRRGESA